MNYSPIPIPAGETINFTSSDENIVSINSFDETSGLLLISGNNAGTATITATYGSASDTITVNVEAVVEPLSIYIDDNDFDDNDNYTLSSTASNTYVNNINVEYLRYFLNKEGYHITATSSDDTVCTVSVTEAEDENYRTGYLTLTGLSNGTANITLTADDENETSIQFGVNVVSEWLKFIKPHDEESSYATNLHQMSTLMAVKGADFYSEMYSDDTESTSFSVHTYGPVESGINVGEGNDVTVDTGIKLKYQIFEVPETCLNCDGYITVVHGDIKRHIAFAIGEYSSLYNAPGRGNVSTTVGNSVEVVDVASVSPEGALLTITSSDNTVADVDDIFAGTVEGKSAGTATITINNNGEATATVTVTVTSE